jgi:hypothetical protein
MRILSPLAAGILVAAAMLLASQSYAQQLSSETREFNGAAQADSPHLPSRRRDGYERQRTLIACTRTGCRPIPPGCWIEIERNWDGLPTGFDAVICRLDDCPWTARR